MQNMATLLWGVSTELRIPPPNSLGSLMIDTATSGGGPAQKDGRGAATPWHGTGASACASATPNSNITDLHEPHPDPLAPEPQLSACRRICPPPPLQVVQGYPRWDRLLYPPL